MKKKFVFALIGLFIFAVCFVASIRVRDYYYEKSLKENIHRVKVRMSEQEVIQILGKPTIEQMSDSSSYYWCYDTDSIHQLLADEAEREIYCGHMLLEMSWRKNGDKWESAGVGKVFDF